MKASVRMSGNLLGSISSNCMPNQLHLDRLVRPPVALNWRDWKAPLDPGSSAALDASKTPARPAGQMPTAATTWLWNTSTERRSPPARACRASLRCKRWCACFPSAKEVGRNEDGPRLSRRETWQPFFPEV
jgi:hypothetical protein